MSVVNTIDILTFRGKKVVPDSDLARAYDVPTKRLNQQVKTDFQKIFVFS